KVERAVDLYEVAATRASLDPNGRPRRVLDDADEGLEFAALVVRIAGSADAAVRDADEAVDRQRDAHERGADRAARRAGGPLERLRLRLLRGKQIGQRVGQRRLDRSGRCFELADDRADIGCRWQIGTPAADHKG